MPLPSPSSELEQKLAKKFSQGFSKYWGMAENAYDKYAPAPVKEGVDYWNKNPDPIPGVPYDNMLKSLPALATVVSPKTLDSFIRKLGPALDSIKQEFPGIGIKLQQSLALAKVRYPSYFNKAIKPLPGKYDYTPENPNWTHNLTPTKLTITHADPFGKPVLNNKVANGETAAATYWDYYNHMGFNPKWDSIPDYFPEALHEFRHLYQYRTDKKLGAPVSVIAEDKRLRKLMSEGKLATSYEQLPLEVDAYKATKVGHNTIDKLGSYLNYSNPPPPANSKATYSYEGYRNLDRALSKLFSVSNKLQSPMSKGEIRAMEKLIVNPNQPWKFK